jgi:hypothetical protein
LDAWSGTEVQQEGNVNCHPNHDAQFHTESQASNKGEETGHQIPLCGNITIKGILAAL